jgi:hypothetical protein
MLLSCRQVSEDERKHKVDKEKDKNEHTTGQNEARPVTNSKTMNGQI